MSLKIIFLSELFFGENLIFFKSKTVLQYAQQGMVLINPTKSLQKYNQGFWRNRADKIFNANIWSKSNNSAKIIEPERDLVNPQLGMVLINPTKFFSNSDKNVLKKSREQRFH